MVDNGPSFLLSDGQVFFGINSRLYSITDTGVVSLIGNMNHHAEGLSFLDHHGCGIVPVGGTTSFLTGGSGSSTGTIALFAGGVAAFVAITAGAWYTRRRWLGSRS